jgi:quinol monooxygenase YgiN
MDTAYGTLNAPPIDYNWMKLFARRDTRRTRLRVRPGIARVLRALGVIAASTSAATAETLDVPATAPALAAADTQAIVELRQYTLHPGQRDTLIDLFEAQFIETQEQSGMRVLAQFRDLDDPDRFVWLRSFADMPSRKDALEHFYGGPAWKANRDAANATMIDSDNVLLMRPADARSRFDLAGRARPALDAAPAIGSLVAATIYYLREPASSALLDLVRTRIEPQWQKAGAKTLAIFATEPAENTFPRLPVRRETVLVTFVAFDDEAAHRRFTMSAVREDDAALQAYLARAPQTLRLQPTRRSLLR